jgi:ribosomal protein S27E
MSNQLLNCARCGKPVSSGLGKCPHCGEEKFKYVPCHHCNTLTKGFELVDCYISYNRSKPYKYCRNCDKNIIRENRRVPLPIMNPIEIKCPTCNHCFHHQPELVKYGTGVNVYVPPNLTNLSDSTYQNKEYNIRVTCPNCGETRCTGIFTHPYVECSWCKGVLNHHEGVAVYYPSSKSYGDQKKIYLHKNCATPNILKNSHLKFRLYSPSELAVSKAQWVFEYYIKQELFNTFVMYLPLLFLVHLILQGTMKINIFPIFVIVVITINAYYTYQNIRKGIEENTKSTEKDW